MASHDSATPAATPSIQPAEGYAGDIAPQHAAQWLADGQALMVDVRTDAEREWVGYVPGAMALAWKQWPGMQVNPEFDAGLRAAAQSAAGRPLLMLCRSGVRSIAAAQRATQMGLVAYNILEGFEGSPDAAGQRGHSGGWRFRGLPWKQN